MNFVVAPQVVAAFISVFKENILKIVKDGREELAQMLDDGLQKYVLNLTDKYGKTKTFLYRDTRLDFYDIYFPLSVRLNKKKTIALENLEDLFQDSNCATILGNAGSGKTMIMKHLFLSTLRKGEYIPIVIELRALNTFDGSLEEYISESIFSFRLSKNEKILKRILESGKFLILLDGFDELRLSDKEKRVFELNSFIDLYRHNYYIVTSRIGANAESLLRFNNFYVNELSRKQIVEFIHKQLILDPDNIELEKRIIEEINKAENRQYQNYLSSPLLLSMFLLTYNNYPELPRSKSKFYYNVFDTLCTRHDSLTKGGGFLHDKKTKLQNEDFEDILKWLSYLSLFEGIFDFDIVYLKKQLIYIKQQLGYDVDIDDLIYDLTVSIAIIIIDGVSYKFPHRSLQEYFTADLIKEQQEVSKEKIYKEKIGIIEDNDFNLWSLCEELDTYCFYKYLAIPKLEDLIFDLENSNETYGLYFLRTYGLAILRYTSNSREYRYNRKEQKMAIILYLNKKVEALYNSFRNAVMETAINESKIEEMRGNLELAKQKLEPYNKTNGVSNISMTDLEEIAIKIHKETVEELKRVVKESEAKEKTKTSMLGL